MSEPWAQAAACLSSLCWSMAGGWAVLLGQGWRLSVAFPSVTKAGSLSWSRAVEQCLLAGLFTDVKCVGSGGSQGLQKRYCCKIQLAYKDVDSCRLRAGAQAVDIPASVCLSALRSCP